MRICILGDAAGIHIHRIAEGMVRRGHEVTVISHKLSEVPEGVRIEKFSVPQFGLSYLSRWENRRRKYLKKIFSEYDVVNLHFLNDFGLDENTVSSGRFLVSVYGSDIVKPPDLEAYTPEIIALRRQMLQMADGITTWSCSLADHVQTYADVPFESVLIGPLGVDTQVFQPRQTHSHAPTVGFFKGFKAVYGPDVLVKAIPLILDKIPDTRFHLISSGDLQQRCCEELVKNGCSNSVTWFDPRQHQCLPEVMGNWDVNVVPSRCESFGAAVLEASAMELPSVASNTGGLPETMVNGETGYLVPVGDPQALAAQVILLLSDPVLRKRMGRKARDYARNVFNWDECLDQWEAIYEHVAGGIPDQLPWNAHGWKKHLAKEQTAEIKGETLETSLV